MGQLDQVGIVVPDLEAAMDGYVANLGVAFQVFEVDETCSSFSGSSAAFRLRFAVALAGLSSIELIQPVEGQTVYSEYLEKHGPGIHHIGRYVPVLTNARRRMERRGYNELMRGKIKGMGQFTYYDAPDLHAILEVLQLSVTLPLFLAEKATWYRG